MFKRQENLRTWTSNSNSATISWGIHHDVNGEIILVLQTCFHVHTVLQAMLPLAQPVLVASTEQRSGFYTELHFTCWQPEWVGLQSRSTWLLDKDSHLSCSYQQESRKLGQVVCSFFPHNRGHSVDIFNNYRISGSNS